MSQQNPNPQPEETGTKRGKNRRARPWVIESRWNIFWQTKPDNWSDWHVEGRYRTEAERDTALDNCRRKYTGSFQFRKGGDA